MRLVLAREMDDLARLQRTAQPFLIERGVDARGIYATRLSLEEAVSNIVRHADGATQIVVGISVAAGQVKLRVEDDGPEFDPLQMPAPQIPTVPDGLGIHLLRGMTTEIRYSRTDGRNVLDITV